MLSPFVRVGGASGVCIRSWGDAGHHAFVLTAEHVTRSMDQNKVGIDLITFDFLGKEVKSVKVFGRVVEKNNILDYSIVYCETPYRYPSSYNTSPLSNLFILEEVIAVGAPNRQNYWVSKGIVSALAPTNMPPGYIGHNAGIYFGSSGGPLFDKHGYLIGINLRLSAGPQRNNRESISYIGFSLTLNQIYKDLGNTKRRNYFGI